MPSLKRVADILDDCGAMWWLDFVTLLELYANSRIGRCSLDVGVIIEFGSAEADVLLEALKAIAVVSVQVGCLEGTLLCGALCSPHCHLPCHVTVL